MLLVRLNIPHIPLAELEYGSESVWLEVMVDKIFPFISNCYRQSGNSDCGLQFSRDQLDPTRSQYESTKHPVAHVSGDFNFRGTDINKRISIKLAERRMLIGIKHDLCLEKLMRFPKKTPWI